MALEPCLVQCIPARFEARANGHFASGLDNARGRAQTLGVEFRIAHTLAIGLEIMETATSQIGARDLAGGGR